MITLFWLYAVVGAGCFGYILANPEQVLDKIKGTWAASGVIPTWIFAHLTFVCMMVTAALWPYYLVMRIKQKLKA